MQVALLVLACVIVVVGGSFVYALYRAFFPKPRGEGDPGNARLHQLAADRVFDALPPDARSPRITLNPAKWRETPFQGAGGAWDGPSVLVTFQSSAGARSVFEYYGKQAPAHGWIANLKGSLHVYDRWKKTYPNGAEAWLRISWFGTYPPPSGTLQYQLTGSISLPRETG